MNRLLSKLWAALLPMLISTPAFAQWQPQHNNNRVIIDDLRLYSADISFKRHSAIITRSGIRALKGLLNEINAPGRRDTIRINAYASRIPDRGLRAERIIAVGNWLKGHGIDCHRIQMFSVEDDLMSYSDKSYRSKTIEFTSIRNIPALNRYRDEIDREGYFVGDACKD